MKKILIWMIALTLLVPGVIAWQDCAPAACSAGFVDNGTNCQGGECYRDCVGKTCTGSWTQVFSDQFFFEGSASLNQASSAGYTSSDLNLCYQFKFDASGQQIWTSVTDPYDPPGAATDCDTQGIAGFWENGKPANPWYESLTQKGDWSTGIERRYWNTTPPGNYFNNIFLAKRDHTEGSSYKDFAYENYMQGAFSMYCAPTSKGCEDLGRVEGVNCSTNCYGHGTYAYIFQSYLKDFYDPATTWPAKDDDLWTRDQCPGSAVSANVYRDPLYRVYTRPTTEFIVQESCLRINEPPNAANVHIEPINPNAGQDIYCVYTFSDPENYTEQGSIYEWWKNGANQNINNYKLGKGNLSVGDNWYCKVTPRDGVNNGTQQTSNTVVIQTTVSNVTLKVDGNLAWQEDSYTAEERRIYFTQELADAVQNCTPDINGNCNITLELASNTAGTINVDKIKIYYELLPNNAPTITSYSPNLNITINENQQITFSVNATDPDGDNITYTWKENGLILGGVNTSNYTKTTDFNSAGNYNITVIVSDGIDQDELTWKLTVLNVNRAPILDLYSNVTVMEGDLVIITPNATDPDGDSITFYYSLPLNSSGMWQTTMNDSGTYPILITASDGDLNDTTQFTLTVLNFNFPPTITGIIDVNIDEDAAPPANWVDLYSYASDPDNVSTELSFTVIAETNAGLISCSITGDRYVDCGTPALNQFGTNNVTVQVSDGVGTDTDILTVTVDPVNDIPTITGMPTQNLLENSGDNQDLFNLETYASDVETPVGSLTYTITSETNTTVVDCSIDVSNNIDCMVQPAQLGNSIVTINVSDGINSSTDTFTVNVGNVNDPPVLTGIPDKNTDEDVASPANWVDLWIYASDPDNATPTLTFTITAQTNSALINCFASSNRYVDCGTPTLNQFGTNNVTVQVSDGEFNDTDVLTVTVNPVNDLPILSALPTQNLIQLSGDNQDLVNFEIYASDVETAASALIYAIRNETNPGMVNCTIDAGNNLDCTTINANMGTTVITIRADDGQSFDEEDIVINVNPVNQAPVITNLPANGTVNEGVYYSFDVDATDSDNDTLIYSILNPEPGMTINSTGLLEWTPNFAQSGVYNINVEVDDGNGGTDTEILNITVNDAPAPDLFVEFLFVQQGAGTRNQMFSFLVRNIGNVSVNAFDFRLYDGVETNHTDIVTPQDPIDPGKTYAAFYNVLYTITGTGTAEITIDPNNDIWELNESNNQQTVSVAVN